ncbi:hypothetical protein [Saccharopolyspora shandongensis]|uniref:hypothetical protein n=1 Tax=Saccharopolyspora shandongensis TaxID=418495 RepID=UPI0033FEA553
MTQQSHVDTTTNPASASDAADTKPEPTQWPRQESPEATFYDHEDSHLILGYN